MMIDLEEFLSRTGIDGATVQHWSARAWIALPHDTERSEISDIDAARATFIRDLQGDFGVNDEGIEIVLHLLDQLHGLRRAMATLRQELGAPPG